MARAVALSLAPDDAPGGVPAASVRVGARIAPATVDGARQREARRYARQREQFLVINLAISAALVAILLVSGLSFWLRDALAGTAGWEPTRGWHPLQIAAYFVVLFVALSLLDAPLSFYSGFVLQHRHGLSTQSLGAWMRDALMGEAISLPIEVAAVELVYWLLVVAPGSWWVWAGLAVLVFTVMVSNLSPVLLLPLFYRLTPLPEGDVRQRALALAAQAHTRVRGIFSMNMSAKTTAANAMVTGLGNTRRIVIADTLLAHYDEDEIEVVVAHELGHQVHHDIPRLIAFQSVVTLGGLFLTSLVLHVVVSHVTRYQGLGDPATMPLVGAALGIFALVTLPLTNGLSRLVERRADEYALQSTGKVDAFISAMTRLANQNLAELEPSPLVEFLLYNHPSIGRRLARARIYRQR